MSCIDNKDGSCDVEYTPYAPGPYDVNITYGGQHIPGIYGPAVDYCQVFFVRITNPTYGVRTVTAAFL